MQRKRLPEQRPSEHRRNTFTGLHHGRTLSARRYVEISRQSRLTDLPRQSFPYVAAAATAASFLYLFYLVLGGA